MRCEPLAAGEAEQLGYEQSLAHDIVCRQPVSSKYSCGEAVVPEQAAQTKPAFNAAGNAPRTDRLWEQ